LLPLRELSAPMLADTSRAGLWCIVAASYVETYLLLAASADVPILIARLYGWSLPTPFRAPLLAWNPVELWRRWGIYNRQFLLRVVYFPLGGNRRHRYRNVILTFLASALVLHSGWFGSKYLEVGIAGWRDESLYFLLQGLAVCACLALWRRTGKEVGSDRGLRWSGRRLLATLATQGASALAHVVILAQGIDLAARFRLIGRCLGL
jgi:D-alanyl-lipoteichoic acid acyltransferase DltB (MBOAT superfamily)